MAGEFRVQSWAAMARRPQWRLWPWPLSLPLTYRTGLAALLLVGFSLRLALLAAFPFREDEAIYSYWSLHLTRVDALALQVWPDKPPLFLWLLGAFFFLAGAGEATARWLNIAISMLTIPVVAATAHRLWGRQAALLAALVFALNPFAISFAPTAYTDPLLVFFGALALYAAVMPSGLWAGIWLGAAAMTKQQGILYIPLILLMAAQAGRRQQAGAVQVRGFVLGALAGFAVVAVPVLWWDSLRWAVAPSPWDLSVRNYGGFALAPPAMWASRLAGWAAQLWYLAGSWPVWLLLGGLSLWRLAMGMGRGRRWVGGALWTSPQGLLVLWSLGFLSFHLATSTQIWDRYLLPLAPLLALLAGAAGSWALARLPRNRLRTAAVMAAAALLLPPALTASGGGYPIGGDHGDYSGYGEVTAWLAENAPAGSVLYHQALGWHYRFTFFEAASANENRFELRWYPHTVYLADNAARIPHRRRFLAVPDWRPLPARGRDLAVRQIEPVERLRAGRFTLYELTGPPQLFCDWCVSTGRMSWPDLLAGREPAGLCPVAWRAPAGGP